MDIWIAVSSPDTVQAVLHIHMSGYDAVITVGRKRKNVIIRPAEDTFGAINFIISSFGFILSPIVKTCFPVDFMELYMYSACFPVGFMVLYMYNGCFPSDFMELYMYKTCFPSDFMELYMYSACFPVGFMELYMYSTCFPVDFICISYRVPDRLKPSSSYPQVSDLPAQRNTVRATVTLSRREAQQPPSTGVPSRKGFFGRRERLFCRPVVRQGLHIPKLTPPEAAPGL
ncbi:MAG: hypothetical protein LBP98_07530 [Tannerella sp.]|nr:hypothetical protein [Tannerella sp.]